MVELNAGGNELVFRFPEVHPEAKLEISFRKTLRIPDDGKEYPLPPGLGSFPMRLVDDFSQKLPDAWSRDGGVLLPMYQAEAMWVSFNTAKVDGRGAYPFAIKVSTGKVSAISGQPLRKGLNMEPQDYVVAPRQPWLDGYNVKKGQIRQFVAMPLGQGYTVEEQLTGEGEFGGLQILVYPMKRSAFERRFPKPAPTRCYSMSRAPVWHRRLPVDEYDMGLAPGGRMRQEIYDDPYDPEEWDLEHYSHCFVHIANSETWQAITGKTPPHRPPTAAKYASYGLPWFDWYAEEGARAVDGAEALQGIRSVKEMGEQKGAAPLPGNDPVDGVPVTAIGRRPRPVREGALGGRRAPKPEFRGRKGYAHVTVILDRSGSMESLRDDAVGGFNAFLEQQKQAPGEATLTLVQFDSGEPYEVIHHFRPVGDVPPLTRETYVPRGCTPLLDAIGRGINDIEARVAGMAEAERPEKVIFAVITDGEENSSCEFDKQRVEQMISRKTADGWKFIFLSADLDAVDEARSLGFSPDSSAAFDNSAEGMACCMKSLSDSILKERQGYSALDDDTDRKIKKKLEEYMRGGKP